MKNLNLKNITLSVFLICLSVIGFLYWEARKEIQRLQDEQIDEQETVVEESEKKEKKIAVEIEETDATIEEIRKQKKVNNEKASANFGTYDYSARDAERFFSRRYNDSTDTSTNSQ